MQCYDKNVPFEIKFLSSYDQYFDEGNVKKNEIIRCYKEQRKSP